MYSLYEGKNDYCVRIVRNIAIWTCWLNRKLTCWLCGYKWGGTMKKLKWKKIEKNKTYLKLAISVFSKWLVNEGCHGSQLVGWNYCCDNDMRILIVKVCRICLIARGESERKWIVHHFVVLIIIIGEISKGMSFLILV